MEEVTQQSVVAAATAVGEAHGEAKQQSVRAAAMEEVKRQPVIDDSSSNGRSEATVGDGGQQWEK